MGDKGANENYVDVLPSIFSFTSSTYVLADEGRGRPA